MTKLSPSLPRSIAIVGGGCAGTLVAVQLLRQSRAPVRVILIERNPPVGCGLAYGTECGDHLLNVPAERMSALPDDPAHFLKWAQARAGHLGFPDSIGADDFLPRWIYGRYLGEALEEAKRFASRTVTFQMVVGEAVNLEESEVGPLLTLSDGRTLEVDAVVLALGVLPGEYPIRRALPFYRTARYVHSPLLPAAMSGVAKRDDLLIVGAGLTAVDIIVQCRQLGHRGVIHALSRRGLRPLAHDPALAPYPAFLSAETLPLTLAQTLHRVRAEVRRASASGVDWRAVLDSIRPVSQLLWQGYTWEERARFMRHVRPFWDALRHRISPATAAIVAEMEAAGRLRFHAGRLVSLRDTPEGAAAIIKPRGREDFVALRVAKVINCTGPRTDYSKYQHPLLINLLAAGLIGHDPLALGIDAFPTGEVRRYGGRRAGWLFTLGAPLKGVLWESTSVSEIRVQAHDLARRLLALKASSGPALSGLIGHHRTSAG
jgi:uncharacterized NAD(P)/FAD-binding protein YdhS